MPPPNPSLFGRFGTGANLEREARQAEKFSAAVEGATDALKAMHGESAKSSGELKKKHAEVAAAIQHVSKALQGTTKDADKYGKAVEKDTKIVLEFAKKHKLSLKEATAMYDRVNQKQGLLNKGMGWGIDKLRTWGSLAATIGAGLKEYRKRLDEIHTGHQLFLSDTALTGPSAKSAWQNTQKYVDGYREAMRGAHEITKKYGVSVDEARNTTKALAFSLRGQIKDVSQLGKVLKEDTDRLYGFAKVMNVDASTALTYFRNQMRVQGKTHAEARKSLDTVIAGYDNMKVKVGAAAAPLKEEYLATLQQIRQEMGPTQVSTAAVTAAMNMMAEGAKKAGLSAKGVTDAMAAIPTLLKGLPKFYKMKIGGGMLHAWKTSEKFRKDLEKSNPAIAKQMATLSKMRLPMFQKAQIAQNIAGGTKAGLKAMFSTFKGMTGAMRYSILKSAGLSDQQYMALDAAMKKGPKAFSEVAGKIQKGTKKATDVRQTLADNLTKNTKGLDGLIKRAFELEQTIKKWMDQYSTVIAPAMGALTLAMNAASLVNGMKGLQGAMGGLQGAAGKAGAAGALVAAGTAGWAFGKWLDKKFGISDKISDWAFKQDKELLSKMERLKRSKGHAGATERSAMDYIKKFEAMRRKGVTTIKKRVSSKGLKMGEKGYTASLVTKEFKLNRAEVLKMTKRRLGLAEAVKKGHMTQAQATAIMKKVAARLDRFEDIKPKAVEAKKAGEKQTAKARARAKVGERAMKAAAPPGRSKVPPSAAKAPAQKTGVPATDQPVEGVTPPGASQFDPAMGTFTAQMTIKATDPNWQQFFQQNQSIMNQGKRGR